MLGLIVLSGAEVGRVCMFCGLFVGLGLRGGLLGVGGIDVTVGCVLCVVLYVI